MLRFLLWAGGFGAICAEPFDSPVLHLLQSLPVELSSVSAVPFTGDLDTWLAAIKFSFPDMTQSFPIFTTTVSLTVSNFSCTNLQIGTLVPPFFPGHPPTRGDGGLTSDEKDGVVAMDLDFVTFDCQAKLAFHTEGLPLSGEADVTVSTDRAGIRLYWGLHSEADGIPNSLNISTCDSNLNLQLKVSGSEWVRIVEAVPPLADFLQGEVNSTLSKFVCSTAIPDAKKVLDESLMAVHDKAVAFSLMPAPVKPSDNESWVFWQNNTLFTWITKFRNTVYGGKLFNDVFFRTTEDSSACVVGPGNFCLKEPGEITVNKSLNGSGSDPAVLAVDVVNAKLLGDFGNLSTLTADNASILVGGNMGDFKFQSSVNFSFNGWAGGAQAKLSSVLAVELSLTNFNLGASILAGFDEKNLSNLYEFDWIAPQCFSSSLKNVTVWDVNVGFDIASMGVSLVENVEVPSPLVTEVVQLLNNLAKSLALQGPTLLLLVQGYAQTLGTEKLTDIITGVFDNDHSCPQPKGYEMVAPNQKGPLISPSLANTFLVIGLLLVALTVTCFLCYLWKRIYRRSQQPSQEEAAPTRLDDCLCNTPMVPKQGGPAMVFILVACVFLFLASNFQFMGESFVCLESAEPKSSWKIYQVMVYSLFYSIEMLKYKAHFPDLAVVLFLFSGLLPYSKLAIMLVCWLLPARGLGLGKETVGLRVRGFLLVLLDEVGKFSMVDIFVIQFISGTMHTSIAIDGTTKNNIAVVLRTNQEVGFMAFVFATIGSLILGHIILYAHEKDPKVTALKTKQVPLEFHNPTQFHTTREVMYLHSQKLGRVMTTGMGPLLFLNTVVLIYGCFLPLAHVKLYTPLGKFSDTSFTAYSFCGVLPSLSEHADGFFTRFGQLTYFVFVLLTIHVHIMLLFILWYSRMSAWRVKKLTTVARTLFAWSALDVCLLSVAYTLSEMTTSDFVGLNSNQLELLRNLSGQPLVTQQGLLIAAEFGEGFYVLIVAVVLHAFLGRVAMSYTKTANSLRDSEVHQETIVLSSNGATGTPPSCPQLEAP